MRILLLNINFLLKAPPFVDRTVLFKKASYQNAKIRHEMYTKYNPQQELGKS